MSKLNKLHNKDFKIKVRTGLDADLSTKFVKDCVKGELAFATDSNRLAIATSTAGSSDATFSQVQTINPVSASVTSADSTKTLAQTDYGSIFKVDTTNGAVNFQINSDDLKAGFICYLVLIDGTNQLQVSVSGTATRNGGTAQYSTTTKWKPVMIMSLGSGSYVVQQLG